MRELGNTENPQQERDELFHSMLVLERGYLPISIIPDMCHGKMNDIEYNIYNNVKVAHLTCMRIYLSKDESKCKS